MSRERTFDVILYGATGFTGRQTVTYFARHAPIDLRWAISGRNRDRLTSLVADVPVLVADSTDPAEAARLACQTRVMLSTAGPFELYGDRLVEACVESGTHYVDISGEVVWVRSLIDRFHEKAKRTGSRIIPMCGFDSVPADVGAYLVSKKLGAETAVLKAYFTAKGGRPNGGTMASAHRTYSSGADVAGKDLFLLSPEMKRTPQLVEADPTSASYDRDIGSWVAPFPMSIIDTRVVRRSCALRGVDFVYQEFLVFEGGRVWAVAAAMGVKLFYAILRSRRGRDLVRRLMPAGGGPSEKTMDAGSFSCRLWGQTRTGKTAEITLSGQGDPGNRITVMCVCESALALACEEDELPQAAGVLTPSTGIGDALVRRLVAAGISVASLPAETPIGRRPE